MLGWLFFAFSIAGRCNFPTTAIAAQGSEMLCLARSLLFNITCVGAQLSLTVTITLQHPCMFRATSLVMWASVVYTERSLVSSASITSSCDVILLHETCIDCYVCETRG